MKGDLNENIKINTINWIGLGLGLSGCATTNYQERVIPDFKAFPIPFIKNNSEDPEILQAHYKRDYEKLTDEEISNSSKRVYVGKEVRSSGAYVIEKKSDSN